jgi:hypothetical protein
MKMCIIETVHDLDEFLSLIAPESRIHYETFWKPIEICGCIISRLTVGVTFYGVSREGYVLKCELKEVIDWKDKRLRKYKNTNIIDDYNAFIKEKWTEYDELAKKIGATKGKFEMVVYP